MQQTCELDTDDTPDDESHWFCLLFGYSLGPKMVDPILTFVLPISICIRLTIAKKLTVDFMFVCKHKCQVFHTAFSKSPDIPMESSNCSVDIPRAWQTSCLQFTNACIYSAQINRPTESTHAMI
jgi:hypothetical protein